MAIDWYQKVMGYYEANPDSTLHSDELEGMLRDKHEAEQAALIEALQSAIKRIDEICGSGGNNRIPKIEEITMRILEKKDAE